MGGSAPKPDANIGVAALKSAQTGEQMLTFMKDQAAVTNKWAAEDRSRYRDTFVPLQDQFIADAQGYDTPERRAERSSEASADVMLQAANAQGMRERNAMAMGVNPNSGRFIGAGAKAATDTALAAAGAGNLARRAVTSEGEAMRANAINLGQGLGVNPATSMGLSNGAVSAGGSAAMQGYGQQGQLLNTQYQQQLQAYESNQGMLGAVGGAFGKLLGALPMMSSKEYKTDKEDFDSLGAIRKMPVQKWTYKEGIADEGTHVGPYAEDFQAATGRGDGKSIPVIDGIGMALGAIRQLDQKIEQMSQRMAA